MNRTGWNGWRPGGGRGRGLSDCARAATLCLLGVLGLAPAPPARAQISVSSADSTFRYTLSLDKQVYGLADSVFATYTVANLTDSLVELPLCCCGVEFYAMRDSACRLGDDECEIAGCDACPVCFPTLNCELDPCIPVPVAPGTTRTFRWRWGKSEVCINDFGADPQFGNVDSFRVMAGYQECGTGLRVHVLDIPIHVLRTVPVIPVRWGTMKTRYGAGSPGPGRDL